VTVAAVQPQTRAQVGDFRPKGSVLRFQGLYSPKRTETKSFKANMSFDNSMNQICALKKIYIDLGCMPKFLLRFYAMRSALILSFIMIGLNSFSQPGFNQSYDFGQLAAGFGSLELSGGTLVVYGTIKQNNRPSFGLLFAQMDTLGNLIHYTVYNDSLGHDFTAVKPNSFIKLSSNSGYAGVAHIFQRTNGCLGLFDNQGELTKFIEFEDANSIVDFYKEVIEVADGFLVLGDKQNASNGVLDIFIMKTDFEGNKIWEKKFTTPGRQTLFGSTLILNENEYVISAISTAVQGVPLPQVTNTSKIFAIDSLGNVKWQWQSQPSLEELGAGSIFKTADGNWAYVSGRGWYNATYNEISVQPKFIIRDENFNVIKDDTFGVADITVNHFYNMIRLNDGGWLAVGVKPVNYPIPPVPMWFNSFSGWMVRLDSQGDQLWSRVDTAFWSVVSLITKSVPPVCTKSVPPVIHKLTRTKSGILCTVWTHTPQSRRYCQMA
jgi:hypothetical protein